MVVQKPKNRDNVKLTFGVTILEQVTEYKYLGITFTEDAKLNVAQEILYKKGLKAYYAMLNTLYSTKQCNVRTFSPSQRMLN